MDRVSKFYIIANTSTLFFAVIDANMKILAGIGAFVFFGESIFWPKIVGFILIAFSLLLSVFEKLSTSYDIPVFTWLETFLGVSTSEGDGIISSDSNKCNTEEESGLAGGFVMQPMLPSNSSYSYTSITPQHDDVYDDIANSLDTSHGNLFMTEDTTDTTRSALITNQWDEDDDE